MEKLLDSREAAEFLDVKAKTLQRLARSGVIHGIKIGKLWRFKKEDLAIDGGQRKNNTQGSVHDGA
jgi:excisionase family DNA binding protein